MIALIERAKHDDLDCDADDDGNGERGGKAEEERAGRGETRRGDIGADHVERAMREIDQIHDAEDQGQPGRHQEQHDAKLNPVQHLLDDVDHECMGQR